MGENPFHGKTPEQIDKILRDRGFKTKGKNPMEGEGCYLHPETGRKYYLDKGKEWKTGKELPHVDVHKLGSEKDKKRYPLGDKLYE